MIHLHRRSRCPIQFLRRLQLETTKKPEKGQALVNSVLTMLFSILIKITMNDCILLFGDAVLALFFLQTGPGDFAVALRWQSAATDRSNRGGQSRGARCRPFLDVFKRSMMLVFFFIFDDYLPLQLGWRRKRHSRLEL